MISVQKIDSKSDWDAFVNGVKGSPLQLSGWGELKALYHWDVERVLVTDGEEVLGGAQILYRALPFPFRSLAYIPRGPLVAHDSMSLEKLLGILAEHVKKTRKAVALSVEPEVIDVPMPSGWNTGLNHVLSAETVYLDLSKSEDELLRDMSKSARRAIRKSLASMDVRRVENREDLTKCLAILHEASERAGFPIHSDQYYLDAFDQLGDNGAVFLAESEGEPVAFDWLATSAGSTYDLYGSANTEGRRLRANYGITWNSIVYSRDRGIAYFDFGGMVEGGVSTFKNHWTKETTHFVGTWDKPLSWLYPVWTKALPWGKKILRTIRRAGK